MQIEFTVHSFIRRLQPLFFQKNDSYFDYRSIANLQYVPYIQSGGVVMNRENFGRFIADARRNKGITQQSLADQLHVTNSAVSKWERGLCYPDVVLLEDLAGALGLTLTELLACEYAAGRAARLQNNGIRRS